MSQYCDSSVLERNWFNWLLATSVPNLEPYRGLGLLWTKVLDGSDAGRPGHVRYPNPLHPERQHCIALAVPIYVRSDSKGEVGPSFVLLDGREESRIMPTDDELTLLSESEIHKLDEPLYQLTGIMPSLLDNQYVREVPAAISWHAMLHDINNMCRGIATKFKLSSEHEQEELAHEALLQVMNKLSHRKLVYTPGRAPVFNLLTTTIHRCMYSILNRGTKRRQNIQKLASDLQDGLLPETSRSLRLPSRHIIKSCRKPLVNIPTNE